jgi:hypothetical protein
MTQSGESNKSTRRHSLACQLPEVATVGLKVVAISAETPPAAPPTSRTRLGTSAVCRVPAFSALPAPADRRLQSWPPPLAAKPLSSELFFAGFQQGRCVYGPHLGIHRLIKVHMLDKKLIKVLWLSVHMLDIFEIH